MESMLGITGLSYDFSSMSISEKNGYLRRYSSYVHRSRPDGPLYDLFYSSYNKHYTVLAHLVQLIVVRYTSRIHRLFVPKFYHDRNDTNFLQGLKYVGEKNKIDEKNFSEIAEFGRKLYEYYKDPKNTSNLGIQTNTLGWPFPEKYYKSIGYTVHGFTFVFPKIKTSKSDIINPKNNLINIENELEETTNGLSTELEFPSKKDIEDKIAEYNAVTVKSFINESYFLYDKSFLIKKTFVTAINKTLSIYGSFSHFSGKITEKEIKLLDASNFLKFFIEKKVLKKDLKFQLTYISGKNPKIKDNKIHNFSITRLGKKRKLNMSQPIESIIIRAQQNFDVAGGLNPIQIEIEDEGIIKIFKNTQTSYIKLRPSVCYFLHQ